MYIKRHSKFCKFFDLENEDEKVKVVTLILNCPCQNLMTCSVISNPVFNSFEIKLSFHGLYDVYTHLEAIYGRVSKFFYIFLLDERCYLMIFLHFVKY